MTRDEIVRRFEAWLDLLLAREDPPGGIDAEILAALAGRDALDRGARDRASGEGVDGTDAPADAVDAYGLWAAVTALTHEIKLQGRAFKELNGTLATQAATMADQLRTAYRERERELQREIERQRDRRILDALIDLHDRLGRGTRIGADGRGGGRRVRGRDTGSRGSCACRAGTGRRRRWTPSLAATSLGLSVSNRCSRTCTCVRFAARGSGSILTG